MTPHEAIEQGVRLHQAGRLSEAEALYAAVLTAQPDFHPALHLLGLLRFHQQNFAGARGLLEQALARQPDAPDSLLYYGATLAALGESDAALAILARAIAAAPNSSARALAFASRGDVFLTLEHATEALADFDQAVAAAPNLIAAWNNRGLALSSLKRPEEALVCFDRVLALMPRGVEAHNNRGTALRELRRYNEALASFARALVIAPNDWATLNNRAIAFTIMGRTGEALADYDRALAIRPGLPEALFARGNLLAKEKGGLARAIADLTQLVGAAPDFPFARGSLMRLKMAAADWADFERQAQLLQAGVQAGRAVAEPLIYLALSDSPADLHRCAAIYARIRFPAQPSLPQKPVRRAGKIRIGYVCGEFRTHATLYLLAGFFEAHDRTQFEITAFDNGGSDGGALRARFESAMDHIVDITGLADAEAAAHIRARDIDILVDLNGYTGNHRAGVFSRRSAPLQVMYLANPGTMGAPFMDYLIADSIVVAPEDEPYYSEKIVRLPHSFQPSDDKRETGRIPSRTEAGLPERGFVFCNFNHAKKYTPENFKTWMRLLQRVPGSVLWLPQPDAMAVANQQREAGRHGVAPERLIFAPQLPSIADHLARLTLADLFLDSLPYGAHTTANDALWAGLPLLTLRGKSFAGRVAASLLTALEMPELIAENQEAYEALALTLARQPEKLAALRAKLAEKKHSAPLFDTARTTRHVEAAYRIMLEKNQPESFVLPAANTAV
jgi:predicted O-linked N-acetylglucosamine transferase (SPINDLY family)